MAGQIEIKDARRLTGLPNGWYKIPGLDGGDFYYGCTIDGRWESWGWIDGGENLQTHSKTGAGCYSGDNCLSFFGSSDNRYTKHLLNLDKSKFEFVSPIKYDLFGKEILSKTSFLGTALPVAGILIGLLASARVKQNQKIKQQAKQVSK